MTNVRPTALTVSEHTMKQIRNFFGKIIDDWLMKGNPLPIQDSRTERKTKWLYRTRPRQGTTAGSETL